MNAQDVITARRDDIIALRAHLHMHPEISRQEFETAKLIERELDKLGIEHIRVGETGVCGFIRGAQPGPVTILRADIDALAVCDEKDVPYKSQIPGAMHACGHDMHTASLLGAAMALSQVKDSLCGEVRLAFQHAEECGYGGRVFRDQGLLKADRALGLHSCSELPVGTISVVPGPRNASCDYFKVTVKGKSAHVSKPHAGVDALNVAARMVEALHSIPERMVDPLQPVVVGIGTMKAGATYNTIADTAEMEGTTRAFTPETRALLLDRVQAVVKNIADIYGAEADVEIRDYAAPLVNDQTVCEEMTRVVRELGLEVDTSFGLALGADDFAEFCLAAPGAYLLVGSREEGKPYTAAMAHNGQFDVAEEAIVLAARGYTQYALDQNLAK